MYTKNQEAIRNSLWNFMGSLMNSSLTEDNSKESVMALMSEEMCKFCKNEDEQTIDMNTAKPILKAASWVLNARILEMDKALSSMPEDVRLNSLKGITNLKSMLDEYINTI